MPISVHFQNFPTETALTTAPSPPTQLDSRETQTTMPLPDKLQVDVPTHYATIKAVSPSEAVIPNQDEISSLEVTIRDAATGTPLSIRDSYNGVHVEWQRPMIFNSHIQKVFSV